MTDAMRGRLVARSDERARRDVRVCPGRARRLLETLAGGPFAVRRTPSPGDVFHLDIEIRRAAGRVVVQPESDRGRMPGTVAGADPRGEGEIEVAGEWRRRRGHVQVNHDCLGKR